MVLVLQAQGLRPTHTREKAKRIGGHTHKRCTPCHALQRREAVLAFGAAIFLADAESSQAGMCASQAPTCVHSKINLTAVLVLHIGVWSTCHAHADIILIHSYHEFAYRPFHTWGA